MFCRQVLIKTRTTLKQPILKKVENVAFYHVTCPHHSELINSANKLLKNSRRSAFNSGLQLRYKSSSSSTSNDSIVGLDPIPEPPVPCTEIGQSAVESAAALGEPAFTSLGLGGWWPSGLVQHALEFLHIDCGLPWWGAIVCGTLAIRTLLFPIVILSQRNAAKLNNNLPQVQYIQMKVTEARQRGDKLEAARYTAELMNIMKEKDVNPIKSMVPAMVQAPIFISVFFGLRGISNVPVESLKTGGILWFVDLTVPDQFYILPVVTSATLYCTLKMGVDAGAPSQNMHIMKYVMMGLPVIMLPFITNFPGALLVYWTTSNFVSLFQVGILRIPRVRDYFKIEKKIKHDKEKLPIKDKGFIRNIKDAWTNMKITSELQSRERTDKMAFMKAGRDPIIKTYKYDPTQIRQQSSSAIQAKKKI